MEHPITVAVAAGEDDGTGSHHAIYSVPTPVAVIPAQPEAHFNPLSQCTQTSCKGLEAHLQTDISVVTSWVCSIHTQFNLLLFFIPG